MNGIIRMILNIVMRRMISKGINAGMNAASGRGRRNRHQMDLEPPRDQRHRNDGAVDLVHGDVADQQDEDAAERRAERDRIRAIRRARRARRDNQ